MYLRNENAYEPDLASPGAAGSRPLVVVNPHWFDPDDPKPDDLGWVESVRLSDMERTTDGKAAAALLAP